MELREGYKQTELGVIPDDWDVRLFGSLVKELCYGPRFNSNDYSQNGNVKTIRGTDISLKGEILYNQVPLAKLPKKLVEYHKLSDGDLVMITTADCGLTGVFEDEGFPFIASAYAVRISLNNQASPLLFKQIFQTNFAKAQIDLFIRKGTVANLPGSAIKKLKFPLPPLPEQTAIATILSDTDQLIKAIQKKIAKKRLIKQGAMQELLRPKEGWVERKLGELLKFGSGKDYKYLKSGVVPVYGTGGIMTFVDQYLYEGASVGIGRKGTIDKPVYLDGKFWTVDTLFYTHSFIDVLPKYIYYQFLLINWKDYNEASGVPSLNKNTLEEIDVIIPSVEEQKQIASILSDMDSEIEKLEKQLAKYKELKQGLMQNLLTGKIRLV